MASPADSDSEQVETSSSSSEYQGTAEDRMITGIPEANLPPRGKKRKLGNSRGLPTSIYKVTLVHSPQI